MKNLKKVFVSFLFILLNLSPIYSFAARAPESVKDAQWVNQVFQKGKSFYETGNYRAAVKEWQSLDPYLDQYPSFKKVIGYLKDQIRNTSGYSAPPPLSSERIVETISKAKNDLQSDKDAVIMERISLAKGSTDQQAWVESTFRKGKIAYDEGDWGTAIVEWEKLSSYFGTESDASLLIANLKKSYEDLQGAKKQNKEMVAQKNLKLQAPTDFRDILTEAQQRLKSDFNQSQLEREAAQKDLVFQETWINATFQKGKAAYEQGNFDQAIEEWDKLAYKFDNRPEFKNQIEVLKQTYQRVREAKDASADFAANQYQKLKIPRSEDMIQVLAQADKDLRVKSDEVMENRRDMEKSLSERQEWINSNFEKGKVFYQQGKYREAFDQWQALLPYLDNDTEFKAVFLSAQDSLKTYEQANESTQETLKVSARKLKTPENLMNILEDSLRQLSKETHTIESQKEKSELALENKQKEISDDFERGKSLYAQGKIAEAIDVWKKITPALENGDEVNEVIKKLQSHYQKSQETQQQIQDLDARQKANFTPPVDLTTLIQNADRDLQTHIDSATQERLAMEQGLKDRDAWIQATMKKAKTAYQQGQMSEAIDEWNKLVSYLSPNSEERAMIERLKKNYFNAEEARKQNKEALDKQGIRLQLPEAFRDTLSAANQKMIAEINEARIEREAMQRNIVDRQAWLISAFQRGKSFYESGRMNEALAEWKKMLNYLDDRSNTRSLVQQSEINAQDAADAKKALADAQAQKESKFSPPAELSDILQQASSKMKQETAEALGKKSDLEKNFSERKEWVNATYNAGKLNLQQGKIKEALEEWEKLSPYFEESSPVLNDLRNLKQAQEQAVQAKKEAVEVMTIGYRGIQVQPEFGSFLKEMSQKLQTETLENQRRKAQSQQMLSERQKSAAITLEKAKLLYQNNNYPKAVEQWYSLLAYLEPDSPEARQIETLKQEYENWDRAQKTFNQTQAVLNAKLSLPEGSSKLLGEIIGQMKAQAQQSDSQKVKADETLASHQAFVDSNYQKGKTLYIQGDLVGALQAWAEIAPSIDDSSAKLIEEAKQNYKDLLEARKISEWAQAKKNLKLKPTEDFSKVLGDAIQKVKVQIQETLAQKEKADQSLADRQSSLNTTFEKGKLFFQSGDFAEALKLWSSLAPELDDADAKGAIENLNRNYQELVATQNTARATESKLSLPVQAPDGLFDFLEAASQTISKKTQESQLERARMEKSIADNQALMATAFQNGKTLLFEQGQWQEALEEWDKLTPFLDEKSGYHERIQELKKAAQEAEAAQKSTAQFAANEYHQLKIPFANDLTELLSRAGEKIKSETQKSQEKHMEMEKALADRQAWATATFDKGKAYYEVGKYKDALEFWATLTPNLENEAAMKALMNSTAQSYQNALEAQKAAADAEAKKNARFEAPAELPKILDELSTKLKTANFEALSQKEKADQIQADRRAEMNKIFEKGSILYQAGNYSDAVQAWSELPAYLEEEVKIKTVLDNLSQSYQSLVAAQRAAKDAQERQEARLAAPEGLSDLLLDAARKLDKETQVTELEHQRTEKTIAEREALVSGVFAEGKSFYNQGKMNEAFLRWRSLLPSLVEEKELDEQLTKTEKSFQTYVNSKQQNQQVLAKKEMRVAAPAELPEILDKANRLMGDQIFEMKNRTAQTEKMLEDRKNWVEVTFQKGKLAYSQGRFKDAVAEWNTLLPFIENGDVLQNALADFERNLQTSMDSSKIAEEAAAKKGSKFSSPDELGVLLMQLNEKVKNEALEANAEKIKAEQTFSERQKWMVQTFDLGKSFYQEGKIDQAIGEWSKLSPYLEEKSGMQKLLDAVKQNYEDAMVAKKGAVEATANDYHGLKLPYAEQMSKLLEDADKKLKEEVLQYSTKQQEVEKTMAERREWSVTTFNKGKVFYDQGQYDEALNQWERLLPYLAEESELKRQIQSLRVNYNAVVAGKNALGGAAENEKPVTLKNEDEILSALQEANTKFKNEAEAAHTQAASSEKVIQDRREWIEYTFQKGKTYYDQGNYAKAVEEWGILGPYLSEHPNVRDMIEEAKKNYSEGKMAQKAIESFETKKASLLPLPQNVVVPANSEKPISAVSSTRAEETQNAQLVSGEIVSIDPPQHTLTVKLYSEAGSEETLTVNFNESTQVDGSDAKSISSIQNGANVDLRYNPQTSQVFYIYVY